MRFDFGEALLNWVQVWRIGRQHPQPCSCGFDDLTHTSDFMCGEIIHADDLAGRKRRNQTLFEIGQKDFAVHRGVHDERSSDTSLPQAGDKGRHLPMTVRNLRNEPLAAPAASTRPGHVG